MWEGRFEEPERGKKKAMKCQPEGCTRLAALSACIARSGCRQCLVDLRAFTVHTTTVAGSLAILCSSMTHDMIPNTLGCEGGSTAVPQRRGRHLHSVARMAGRRHLNPDHVMKT